MYHCSLVARLLIYESMLKVTDSRIYGSQKPSVHNLPNPAENNCSWLVINIGYRITCLIYAGPCHPKNSVLRPLRFPSIREYFELLTASHLSNRMSTKTHGSKDYLQDEIRYPCAEASMIVHAVYEIYCRTVDCRCCAASLCDQKDYRGCECLSQEDRPDVR